MGLLKGMSAGAFLELIPGGFPVEKCKLFSKKVFDKMLKGLYNM